MGVYNMFSLTLLRSVSTLPPFLQRETTCDILFAFLVNASSESVPFHLKKIQFQNDY